MEYENIVKLAEEKYPINPEWNDHSKSISANRKAGFIDGYQEALKSKPLDDGQEGKGLTAQQIWNMAITIANNICVNISNRLNNDDMILEADVANRCHQEIMKYYDDDYYVKELAALPVADGDK